QLIAERSALGSRASVKEQGASLAEYLCHVYVRSDGLAGVVIADNEYPQRVCFTLLDKVLEEFSREVSKMDWPSGSPATISYSALDGYLSKYQVQRAPWKWQGRCVGSSGTCWDPPGVPVVVPAPAPSPSRCCLSPEPARC
ncbi:hypothetical protein EK904_014605, partial [Melospiza melodia maxima]